MAAELATARPPSNGGANGRTEAPVGSVEVLLDERELRTIYINAYRMHTLPEEVAIDLGFNMPNPNHNGQNGAQQQILFKVTDRVVMSYSSAKRMAAALTQLVRRYEQQVGEIPAPPRMRARPQVAEPVAAGTP